MAAVQRIPHSVSSLIMILLTSFFLVRFFVCARACALKMYRPAFDISQGSFDGNLLQVVLHSKQASKRVIVSFL